MRNWNSPEEIAKDGAAFGNFMHALLGLYIWEWFTSLNFDWKYISRQKPFRWPLIFYFLNRYCLLFALIGISVALNVTSEINCQGLYTFNQCFGNAAIGLASINLSLRTMAVWSQRWYIVIPLTLVIMGHWSLLLHGILLKATYLPTVGCVITETDNQLLAVTFIYSMAFDFMVLCLTAWKLVISGPTSSIVGRTKLSGMIFGDGLIFFIIAFLSNLLATIFMLLNLNPVMSIIANVPAAIASTIVACRAVRRLSKFTSEGAERFQSSGASTLAFRTSTTTNVNSVLPKRFPKIVSSNSVSDQVPMDTFDSPMSEQSGKTIGFVEYDAMGNVIHAHKVSYDNDPEAQEIRGEFKRPPY